MRRGKGEAHLVAAFAAATGRAKRTAQEHAQKRTPEWVEFVSRHAAGVFGAAAAPAGAPAEAERPAGGVEVPAAATKPEDQRSNEEKMEASAWECWEQTMIQVGFARREKRWHDLPPLHDAERKAAESYRKAKQAREVADLKAGRVVPVGVILELKRRFAQPLRAIMENMPMELAQRCAAFDRDLILKAATAWVSDRFKPQLESAVKAFEDVAP